MGVTYSEFLSKTKAANILAPLVRLANQAKLEIKWCNGDEAICMAVNSKGIQYVIMAGPQLEDMAIEYRLDYDLIVVGILAHELGHCMAVRRGDDFSDEELAWQIAFTLIDRVYGCLPHDIIKLSELCLATYGIVL